MHRTTSIPVTEGKAKGSPGLIAGGWKKGPQLVEKCLFNDLDMAF